MRTPVATASVEIHLERYPWATLSDDRGEGEEIRYLRDEATQWIAYSARHSRLPGPFDVDVYIALCQLFNELRKPDNGYVEFQFRTLCQMMRRDPGGSTYDAIGLALKRLFDVRIITHQHLSKGSVKARQTGFSILGSISVDTLRTEAQHETKFAKVTFNPVWVDSVRDKFRLLDTDTYFSLQRPSTRRLYRYLDYRRYQGSTQREVCEVPLRELVGELPLTRSQPSQVTLALAAAHTELQAIGYLRSYDISRTRLRYEFVPKGESAARGARESMQEGLMEALLESFKDEHSTAFYRKVVRTVPDQIVWRLFGNVREMAKANPARARKIFTAEAKKVMRGIAV